MLGVVIQFLDRGAHVGGEGRVTLFAQGAEDDRLALLFLLLLFFSFAGWVALVALLAVVLRVHCRCRPVDGPPVDQDPLEQRAVEMTREKALAFPLGPVLRRLYGHHAGGDVEPDAWAVAVRVCPEALRHGEAVRVTGGGGLLETGVAGAETRVRRQGWGEALGEEVVAAAYQGDGANAGVEGEGAEAVMEEVAAGVEGYDQELLVWRV